MAICFHGTTLSGLRAIFNNIDKPEGPWTCSNRDNLMYVWPKVKLEEGYDYEDESQMIEHAFESAQIQAVVAEYTQIFTLVLDIPDELLKDDVSCPNMGNISSCIEAEKFNPDMVLRVFKVELNKWNAPFVIAGILGNDFFNSYAIDEKLLEMAEVLKQSNLYLHDIEFDYYDCTDTFRLLADLT